MTNVNLERDIRAIAQIDAIPMILRTVKRLTGLRCAVDRVPNNIETPEIPESLTLFA